MGKAFSLFFLLAVFVLLAGGINFGIYKTLEAQGVFNIKYIGVKGNYLLNKSDIVKLSGIDQGIDIFSFKLDEAEAGIRSDKIIESALVKRVPPDRIEIEVREKKPVAIVTDSTNFLICDRTGNILAQGIISNYPKINVDDPLDCSKSNINNEFIKALLENISGAGNSLEIKTISIKSGKGVFMEFRDLEGTLFYLGKNVPDKDIFNRAGNVAEKIKSSGLKIGYVDINNESAIGIKE